MRIALDATYTTAPEPTGIGIYSQRLIAELACISSHDRLLLCYRPKQFFQSFASSNASGFRLAQSRRLLQSPLPVWGADVFHALNQRVDRRPAKRVVTTFHDLFVMTSEYSTPDFRRRFTLQAQLAATNSDLIIAVSQFTASQVHELLNIPYERIRVVSHGVDPQASPAPEQSARENIVLFVGALQERKNIVRLIGAFEKLPATWRLVLAGSKAGFGAARILDAIRTSAAADRIEVTGYVSDVRVRELYRRAAIFAFPSLDEGFGIPVLEAMSQGLPVMTSNRSALPEVSGDAALLVDPYGQEEITEGLARLAGDEDLRNDLRQRGLQRATQFTWQKTAALTRRVYEEIIGLPD